MFSKAISYILSLRCAVLCAVVLFCGQWTGAQDVVFQVQSRDTLRVVPGKVFTLSIPLVNSYSYAQSAQMQLSLPESWRNLIKKETIQLDKEEIKNMLLHIYPSQAATAGEYTIMCEVVLQSEKHTYLFPCLVEEIDNVQLTFGKIPDFLQAGDTIQTELHILNAGNVARDFVITVRGINGADTKETIHIAPSSSAIYNIREITDKNIQQQTVLNIYANAGISNTEKPIAFASAAAQLIPPKEKADDRYLRIPSYVETSYIGRYHNQTLMAGWQIEASGSGYFDDKQKHQLEYRLRGPDTYYISSIGNYEEYFITYAGPNVKTMLGDGSYRLSWLTEYSRYGRGAYIEAKINRWRVGGFYTQPRFYPEIKDEIAGFAEYHFGKANKIRANFLNKRLNPFSTNAVVSGLEGYFTLSSHTKIETEYARSQLEKRSGNAFRANITSAIGDKIAVNGYIIFADKDFSGYYRNSLYYGADLHYKINRHWSLNAGTSKTSYNLSLDTLFTQAPARTNHYAGIGYRLNEQHRIDAQGGFRSGKDRLQQERYNYDEYYGRATHSFVGKKRQLFSTAELYKTKNRLSASHNERILSQTISTNFNYQFNKSLNVGAFVSYNRHNRYSQQTRNYLFAGISGGMFLAKQTRLDVRMQNSFSIEDDYQDRSYFDVRFSHFLGSRHEFSLQNRYALPRKQTSNAVWEFGIQYRFHFGLPVGRKAQQRTKLKGYIHTANPSGFSFGNVLLRMSGKSVYTDADGHFEFKNMLPGNHFLFIDKSKMGIDIIAGESEPIKVTLEEKNENILPIILYRAANVSGKIVVQEDENTDNGFEKSEAIRALTKAPEVVPVVVELYNDNASYKRITDKNSTFQFRQLIPGKWKLKVYPNGLARRYEIEKEEYEFELTEGGHKTITIPLLPKKINIRFRPSNITSLVMSRE